MNALSLVRELEGAGVVLEARGDRLRVNAPKGVVTAELREQMTLHKPAILELLTRAPKVDTTTAMAAAEAYRKFWPLTVPLLCRALVASRHPLISTPIAKFLEELAGITPEMEAAVRAVALQAIQTGDIPKRAVDLREPRN